MSRLTGIVFMLAVSTPVAGLAEQGPDIGDLEVQLMMVDKISYHPSLMPLVMENLDYLDLTSQQEAKIREWRRDYAPEMLEKIRQIVRGRVDFQELSLNPESTRDDLARLQQQLFRLQEDVLRYKLWCRDQILESFTPEQWDSLRLLYTERQMAGLN
ncbi:MAG TPA: hypothetical protein VET88_03480 [Gammaproteobacteria bacterium]|nr:hypothetical protein [Gammaproteobacteria bacterium]